MNRSIMSSLYLYRHLYLCAQSLSLSKVSIPTIITIPTLTHRIAKRSPDFVDFATRNKALRENTGKFFSLFGRFLEARDGSGSSTAAATAIAEFIRTGALKQTSDDTALSFTWACGHNIFTGIPVSHPWHAAMVEAVRILHAWRDDPIYSWPGSVKWSSLGSLPIVLWDSVDSICASSSLHFSFALFEMLNLPIAGIQARPFANLAKKKEWDTPKELEEPPSNSPAKKECVVWTACEWLLHTAALPRELAVRNGVDGDTSQRVVRAIASMEAAELKDSQGGNRTGRSLKAIRIAAPEM
ncbi:hypothetical protein B0T25DRAFT_598834 [Lasiosphaeria hispida]|uniref:Uncharacterized protein n=1 Tax=Lasiosphaeria hispida TaxID=260671 RepID=A0AAJ0HX70_9PEZI|nr:hypothetical protein B0T25DRAFT_598834 [Lasiosphaeria hispida]